MRRSFLIVLFPSKSHHSRGKINIYILFLFWFLFLNCNIQTYLLNRFLRNGYSRISLKTFLFLIFINFIFFEHERFWLIFFLLFRDLHFFLQGLISRHLLNTTSIFIIFCNFNFIFILLIPHSLIDVTFIFNIKFWLLVVFFLGKFRFIKILLIL